MKMLCRVCDDVEGFPPGAKPNACPICGSPYDE